MQKKIATLLLGCFTWTLLLVPAAAQQDDDRFESDNQATTVRSPVLDLPAPFDVPFKIKRSELADLNPIAAADLSALSRMENKDAMVLGRVESVYIPAGNNLLILNFGSDHRQCFKVVIDRRNFSKFGSDDPRRIGRIYDKKTVAVDGLVSYNQRLPQMVVTLPQQLKIVAGQ